MHPPRARSYRNLHFGQSMPFNFRCFATLSAFKSGSFASLHSINSSHVNPSCCFSHYIWLFYYYCYYHTTNWMWDLVVENEKENTERQHRLIDIPGYNREICARDAQTDKWKKQWRFFWWNKLFNLKWNAHTGMRSRMWNVPERKRGSCDKALIENFWG